MGEPCNPGPAGWLNSGLLALILATAGYMAQALGDVRSALGAIQSTVAVNQVRIQHLEERKGEP